MKKSVFYLALAAILGLCGPNIALAIPGTACKDGGAPGDGTLGGSVDVGTSTTLDVVLGGVYSTQCEILLHYNSDKSDPTSVPTDGSFGTDDTPVAPWIEIGDNGAIVSSTPIDGVTFTKFSFTGANALNGTWGLTWTGSGGVDLVFSMHAGGNSGYFILPDELLPANGNYSGTWTINWLNNGQQNPDESNVQVWARTDDDIGKVTGTGGSVPEPQSLALLGLGLLALAMQRMKRKA